MFFHGSSDFAGIAHRAIKLMFDHDDGLEISQLDVSAVREAVMAYFEVAHRSELLQFFYSSFEKSHVAKFCTVLATLADSDDELSRQVFRDAGRLLGRHVAAIYSSADLELRNIPGGTPVICIGSVFNSWHLLVDGEKSGQK